MKTVAVLGAGAIGSMVGGHLTRAGVEVTLIDQWPEHIEAMKRDGLRITGTRGEFRIPVRALHLHELQSVPEPFDLVLLAVKSYDTDWSTTLIKPYVSPTGCVVSLQNGMNDERVAAIVGYGRTVGCTVFTGSALVAPGHIVTRDYPGFVAFKVGELHGRITPRARAIAALLGHASAAEVITNLWGERWSKLVTNCMGNPLSGIGGEDTNSFASDAGLRLTVAVAAEAIRVGEAMGFAIEPVRGVPVEVWKEAAEGKGLDALRERFGRPEPRLEGPSWAVASSMAQDLAKGRRTEIDALNGYVIARGREVGVPTPANEAIVEVLGRVVGGALKAGAANFARALERMAALQQGLV